MRNVREYERVATTFTDLALIESSAKPPFRFWSCQIPSLLLLSSLLLKGQAKISSMNRLNCVSELMSNREIQDVLFSLYTYC